MDIHKAARAGDLTALQDGIKGGDDINSVDEGRCTPLYVAAREGHTNSVRELLSSGAMVDLANKDRWTPLYVAAREGHTDCVRELLSSGAVVDLADKRGWTPLMKAARGGRTDCVRELLSSGAVVDLADKNGCTPLYWAASGGHTDCVRQLLSSGAVVDLANMDGWTPLCLAAREGRTDCVRQLLSSGAVVNLADKGDGTPLYWAVRGGYTDCVRVLLSSGPVVDLADKDGDTPLMEAAYAGQEDTVKKLLSSGASVLCTNEDGQTALMRAKRSYRPDPSVIKLLEEAAESHSRPQSVQVLPKNWTVITDTETKKPVYQNKAAGETLSTPPGYPLHQTSAHPDVTFYDVPQEKEFTSSGGHADFDNGVQVAVPPNVVPAGTSVSIKVQPSLASKDVFVMPEGIQSASPSYLISGEGLNGEVTLSMEHHVRVSTHQEADDLLFLQADSSPKRSGSKSMYEYQEVQEGRSEFTPGGNTGRLTLGTRLKNFFKIGRRGKKGNTDSNLYTVRVYRSPPHTTGDRMALVIVSYFNRLFLDFLRRFEVDIIPREYPHLSSSPADKTIKQPLCFVQVDAVLELVCDPAWRSVPDQRMISQEEVDLPVIGKFSPEELQCYPPRIVCRFFPEQGAVSCTTCTLSLYGFDKPVSVDMALLTPQRSVDTKQLKEATEVLRRTVGEMTTSQLGSTVESVLSLMEKMTTALQSSSLSELTGHTDSIRTEIASVLVVTRRVVQECTVQSISENMGASLSKMETLSHQLCMVAKVKLRNCHEDQSEETAALVDLVENGANLLRAVDCLLRDIHTLSAVSGNAGYSVLVSCSEKIVQSLSHEPKALAVRFLSVGLITERVLQETNQLNEINADKATRLYTALLGVVKHHPHKYHKFVSTLRLNPLHTDLVTQLDSKYM
ncbi:uncharacterized protein LOC135333670 isoform X2 [Halichondria panicea]|uniref:uncharacterized protein LOC135333670 isoform X2 n=1 Tax=Halichondria panicea TaxID=6063 RepID=UPI00312BA358